MHDMLFVAAKLRGMPGGGLDGTGTEGPDGGRGFEGGGF
jgi:hypothetical protein